MSKTNEREYAAFTSLIRSVAKLLDPKLEILYTERISLINYAFVCGFGVIINMALLSFLVDTGLGLMVSNLIAIFAAFISNWTFSVGPYGHLFDLKPQPKKLEE